MKKFADKTRCPSGTVRPWHPPDPSSCSQVSRNRQAIRQVLRESNIQPKLAVGSEDDVQEREADRVAELIMRMPDPLFQTGSTGQTSKGPPCGEDAEAPEKPEGVTPWISCKAEGAEVGSDIESGMNALKGGGQPLSSSARSFFEPRFGYDFGGVRVHRDARGAELCRSIGARAFTLGRNICFAEDRDSNETSSGKRLLAHELTHVVQQHGGSTPRSENRGLPVISSRGTSGNRQPESDAPVTVQRACGYRAIGPKPSHCNLVTKSPAGTRYLFRRGCDDFDVGQRDRLNRVARSLPVGATVDILGMASSDGRPDFNESLACHRADAALGVFVAAGKASQVALVEATGAVPGTDNDVNFRAVDIAIHLPGPPPPPEPQTPEPVPPPPSIPVSSCPCPAATPSCPSSYCGAISRPLAIAMRAAQANALIGVITALGGIEVGVIYSQFVWGGRAGLLTLSPTLRAEFANICQTEVATHHIMNAIVNAIWGRYPSSTVAHRIPLSALAATAVADIDTPGNPHELVYCGAGNAPGLLAGGVGKTQLTTRVGAIPSHINDARIATGYVDVSRTTLPGGGIRLEFTPTLRIEIIDTVDFCPGNCGDPAAQVATVPFSIWEASGISGDVPFTTQFDAPRSQLRKIVLESAGGTDRWSLEPP